MWRTKAMQMAEWHYRVEQLTAWIAKLFSACGLPTADAAMAAQILARTEARGIRTHGLSRLRSYVDKIRRSEVNPRPQFTHALREGVLYCDGDNGLGQVIGAKAMDLAISLARETAFVPCFVKDTGHLGAPGILALRAAESGFVAFFVQASAPSMALPGAKRKAIGNSPLAFAFPRVGTDPFVFDMATSRVSRGHVLIAARNQGRIPEGWAVDRDGQPTTDAKAALEGAMLPVGDHKGIGLSMMIECLSASLTGTTPPPMIEPDGSSGSASMRVGAFFFVANPARIIGAPIFDAHIAGWIGNYLAASAPGTHIPGEQSAERERRSHADGIPVSPAIVDELQTLGADLGVPFAFADAAVMSQHSLKTERTP